VRTPLLWLFACQTRRIQSAARGVALSRFIASACHQLCPSVHRSTLSFCPHDVPSSIGPFFPRLIHGRQVASLSKLRSRYHKSMKYFLGYNLLYSVTAMLLQSGLPSLSTILSNCRVVSNKCVYKCNSVLVRYLCVRGLAL